MAIETLSLGTIPTKAKSKRVVIYTRVSTIDQHPETQLYDLREMAKLRGYEIVCEYSDKISGAKQKRPGLDQLLSDSRRHKFRCRARLGIRSDGSVCEAFPRNS
jgi:predicted site-specific integrase-resolvase